MTAIVNFIKLFGKRAVLEAILMLLKIVSDWTPNQWDDKLYDKLLEIYNNLKPIIPEKRR